jgi:acyl-CoA thioester hydrolase
MSFVDARLRVRYAETDQMGVVYHANYLVWMEVGRVEYCRASGARYRDLETEAGILLAVVEVSCRYYAPARYDDEVIVRTRIEQANPRMVRFGYELTAAEGGRCLASGFTKHIFCGRDFRATKLPEKYRPLFGIGSDSAE